MLSVRRPENTTLDAAISTAGFPDPMPTVYNPPAIAAGYVDANLASGGQAAGNCSWLDWLYWGAITAPFGKQSPDCLNSSAPANGGNMDQPSDPNNDGTSPPVGSANPNCPYCQYVGPLVILAAAFGAVYLLRKAK